MLFFMKKSFSQPKNATIALCVLLMGWVMSGMAVDNRNSPARPITVEEANRIGADRELVLDNECLRVGLRRDGSKIWLAHLVDKKDGFDFLADDTAECPLWEITFCAKDATITTAFRGGASGLPVDFRGRNGDFVSVDSLSSGGEISWKHGGGDSKSLALSWKNIRLPDNSMARVQVTVEMDKDRKVSFWYITVDSGSKKYTPWAVRFVGVRGLQRAPDKKNEFVLIPAGVGLRDPAPLEDCAIEWMYPSACMGIQMSAYLLANQNKGFFTACYDPKANTKKFRFSIESGVRSHYWEHYPENMGASQQEYRVPYPVVLGVFDGDWFEASQIYKEWAIHQFWAARGKMSETKDIPQWFKDMHMWKRPDGDPLSMKKNMGEFRDWLNTPFCVQWYCWNTVPFDALYPDFFPARPGFSEAVAEMQEKGIRIFPYINGLLCDPKSDTWKEGAEKWVSKTVEGKMYQYPEKKNFWSYHMCPSTKFWQDKIHSVALRLGSEAAPSGVYFDCVGGMDTKLCFDKTHGHPLGGGHYWYEGFRSMLKKIRKDYREKVPDAAFATELMAEPLIDVFDGVLMCTIDSPRLIPLFQAIYGEYIVTFGRGERWEDWEQDGCFENREAEAFTFGQQLGHQVGRKATGGSSENFELDPQYKERSAFFKELIAARRAAAKFLVYGRMATPLRLKEKVPMVSLLGTYKVFGGEAAIKPVLYHSTWVDQAGHVGLVFVNSSREDVNVSYNLDPAKYGFRPGKKITFHTVCFEPGGNASQNEYDYGIISRSETVRPRSVLLVEVGQ